MRWRLLAYLPGLLLRRWVAARFRPAGAAMSTVVLLHYYVD